MPHRVLVVDDHPETLSVVAAILRQSGYEVLVATGGQEALALAESEKPALILLDVMMPDMDGYEVCRRLRANPLLPRLPIILFTVMSDVGHKWAGFEAGADDYLIKPTNPDELTRRMSALLGRAGGTAELTEKLESLGATPEAALAGRIATTDLPAADALVGPPLTGLGDSPDGVLIVVVGARGGCGTTTVAINLAYTLATDGYETVLADLDLVQGHVATYLDQKAQGGVHALASVRESLLARELDQHLFREAERLQLLLAHPNLDRRLPMLSVAQTGVLMESLRCRAQCVVVDLGRGLPTFAVPVLEQASQVLVCLRPERVAISAARQLLRQLRLLQGGDRRLHALMVDLEDDAALPRSAVEEFLRHPLLETVQISRTELAYAVNRNRPLVRSIPRSRAAAQFREVTRQLVPFGVPRAAS